MVTSLININGGELRVNQRNANHNDAYTHIQQTLSQVSSMAHAQCTVLGYDVESGQKLESLDLYDYLILFQYPWFMYLMGYGTRELFKVLSSWY